MLHKSAETFTSPGRAALNPVNPLLPIQTPLFLIEMDNTQDKANHVHSVWRDLTREFGAGDALKSHYAHDHATPKAGQHPETEPNPSPKNYRSNFTPSKCCDPCFRQRFTTPVVFCSQ